MERGTPSASGELWKKRKTSKAERGIKNGRQGDKK